MIEVDGKFFFFKCEVEIERFIGSVAVLRKLRAVGIGRQGSSYSAGYH